MRTATPTPLTVEQRARSFDAWADEYDRYRPPYPAALFEAIAERLALPPRPRVADIGAGTGRASLAMAGLGWRVTAVEPGEPMRAALARAASGSGMRVAVVEGTAEATGLPAASVDLATAAQAFHFFDRAAALAEMARVARPGGGIALFWNMRDDDRSPFLADYTRLLERHVGIGHLERRLSEEEVDTRAEILASGAFEPQPRIELRHEVTSDVERFIGMAFTSSYIRAGLSADEQEALRAELRSLLERHHDDRPFVVPYRVDCWIARRTDA